VREHSQQRQRTGPEHTPSGLTTFHPIPPNRPTAFNPAVQVSATVALTEFSVRARSIRPQIF
ncbi:MAG: hypothetical protein K2G01_04320, partial [Paramuribaculum sp.]|nr:hypothetical protein [Paramuribaculum sp.]